MSQDNQKVKVIDVDCASTSKKTMAFWGLLVLGTGFAIGGVFCAPLFAVSIGCFGGAVGISHTMGDEEQISVSIPPNMPKGVKVDLNIQAYRRCSRLEVKELPSNAFQEIKSIEETKSNSPVLIQYNHNNKNENITLNSTNVDLESKKSHLKIS